MKILYKWLVRSTGRYRRQIRQRRQCRQAAGADQGRLILSESDYYRLMDVVKSQLRVGRIKKKRLMKLRRMVKAAEVRPLYRMPPEVATMNSEIALLTRNSGAIRVRLVYPEDADKRAGRLSITSQSGMCLLGRRQGDPLRFSVRVHEVVYQPEANDDFHL